MAVINWSAEAKGDLADIVAYYEDRSPTYAETLVRQIYEAVGRLERFPRLGRNVPELELESFQNPEAGAWERENGDTDPRVG